MKVVKGKHLLGILLVAVLLVSGCTSPVESNTEQHATSENVAECFDHHAGETFEEALGHCQEDICGTDIHCFEEVEEFALGL